MTLKNLVLLGLIVGAVAWYSKKQDSPDPTLSNGEESARSLEQRAPEFRCEGKIHCSQMSSCEEAMFYLEHCSGTKMDGDGDGIPCESQHCGSH